MTTLVTLADHRRAQRVANQHRALERIAPTVRHGVVGLREEEFSVPGVELIAHVNSPKPHLARARNLAGGWAAQAGDDEVIIFLDADCLPAPGLVERYEAALAEHPDAVVSGPVTYLAEGDSGDERVASFVADPGLLIGLADPHEARPRLAENAQRVATDEEYSVFWSLTFALTGATWRRLRSEWGGFDEDFSGYGGEDTDFGWQLREHGVPLWWVGGAHAFHVWHPVSSPPWENLPDIVVNANVFHDKWGLWPMEDWLRTFERAGAVELHAGRWRQV